MMDEAEIEARDALAKFTVAAGDVSADQLYVTSMPFGTIKNRATEQALLQICDGLDMAKAQHWGVTYSLLGCVRGLHWALGEIDKQRGDDEAKKNSLTWVQLVALHRAALAARAQEPHPAEPMIERLARGMFEYEFDSNKLTAIVLYGGCRDWYSDLIAEQSKDIYRNKARAFVRLMREPTPQMTKAGNDDVGSWTGDDVKDRKECARMWGLMVDAILAGK